MRRTPLSAERIVATAVRMADDDGIATLTLRRLAAELHVHVTSLYNHVATWDAVLDGMVEHLLVDAKLPTGEVQWREWVTRFFDGIGSTARRHPGAFGVLLQRPVQGAEATATYEAGLGAFRRAGLEAAAAYGAVRTVALTAVGFGAEQAAAATGQKTRTGADDLPPGAFPNLTAAVPVIDRIDGWRFVSETLVAGLASQVRRARR